MNAFGHLTDRQKWWALAVLLVGQLMMVLDVSVVNVALPTIEHELHFSQASLAWVVNAYLISFGGLLLLAGRLSDLLGRKKVFLAGMGVFTLSSVFCGMASNGLFLIAARFFQGIGAAMVSAVVLGILFALFTTHKEQARALGYYGVVGAAGASIGLIVGGTLTQFISWHWIFYINIPFGVAAFLLGMRLIPGDTGLGFKKGLDLVGAIILVAGLVSLIYSIIDAGSSGWLSASTVSFFAFAVFLFAIFIAWERRVSAPLLPLHIFRTHNLAEANIAMFFTSSPLIGGFFITALYLQNILGLNAFQTGLAFIPQMFAYGGMGMFIIPRILAKFGGKKMITFGIPIFAISMVGFALVPANPNYWLYIVPPMLLYAIGGTLTSTALNSLSMSEVNTANTGLASGILNTSRQIGSAMGVALFASIAAVETNKLFLLNVPYSQALGGGYRSAFWIAALLVAGCGVISLRLRAPLVKIQTLNAQEQAALSEM